MPDANHPLDSTQSAQPPPRAHLVLAEDDAPLRRVLGEVLRLRGFLVDEVADGFELLSALDRALATGPRPDLLITDLRMPGIDGMDALVPWVAERIPTIVMTAFGDPETHALALARGAAVVMDKPFGLRELIANIERLLANSPTPESSTFLGVSG